METVTLLAQTGVTALMAGWLTLGVRDNILHPALNEDFTSEVLRMERMERDFPKGFEAVAHRRVESRALRLLAFRLIVLAEAVTSLVLWAGVAVLVLALFGVAGAETGKAIALLGALMFTGIWGMFTVVGNHFNYWFCHEGAQNTHFQLMIWGTAHMVFLSAV